MVGLASGFTGMHHLRVWRGDSLAAGAATSLIAWLLTFLAMGYDFSTSLCLFLTSGSSIFYSQLHSLRKHLSSIKETNLWSEMFSGCMCRLAAKEIHVGGGYRPRRLVNSIAAPPVFWTLINILLNRIYLWKSLTCQATWSSEIKFLLSVYNTKNRVDSCSQITSTCLRTLQSTSLFLKGNIFSMVAENIGGIHHCLVSLWAALPAVVARWLFGWHDWQDWHWIWHRNWITSWHCGRWQWDWIQYQQW